MMGPVSSSQKGNMHLMLSSSIFLCFYSTKLNNAALPSYKNTPAFDYSIPRLDKSSKLIDKNSSGIPSILF